MSHPRHAERLAGVSFDATGTLISCPKLGEIYSSVLARHGVDLPPDQCALFFRQAWQQLDCIEDPSRDRWARHPEGEKGWWSKLIRRLCAMADAPEPSDFALAELFHRFTLASAWSVYSDVVPLLRQLRVQNVPCVVTSNWDVRLHQVLQNLDLAHRFESIICSQEVGVAKPAPGIFEAARYALDRAVGSRSGVDGSAAGLESRYVHVGDHPVLDAEGAVASGFEGVLLARNGGGDISSLDQLLTYCGEAEDLHSRQC